MHRVLETLHQLLQMSDALLETTKRTVVWAGRRWSRATKRVSLPDLPDPGDQSLTLGRTHLLSARLVRGARGGYRRRSASVILRITSEPLSTCSRTTASFSARFSSARSRAVFTASSRSAWCQ